MNRKPIPLKRFIIPILITATLITLAGIHFRQNFLMILPLYISLFVMILSSRVNRYSFLLGGLNSIIYSFVFLSFGLYGMMAQALLISFPLQMISFMRWKRHSYKQSVYLRRMNKRQILMVAILFLVVWLLLLAVLEKVAANYALFDNTITLFGILTSVLTMLAFVEYTYLSVVSGLIHIVLYTQMLPKNPERLTYLIFSVYSLICIIVQFFNAKKLYNAQKNELIYENISAGEIYEKQTGRCSNGNN